MSFTLFFKIYAHPPTVCSLLAFTHRSARCVCLSDVGVVQKKVKSKVCMYNKSSLNLPDQWSLFSHRPNTTT